MGLFREVKLKWQGQDYWVTPTNRIIRRMENEGTTIGALAMRLSAGEPMLGNISFVIATLLAEAGVKASGDDPLEDEVLMYLNESNRADVEELAATVLMALVPQGLDAKKPVARADPPDAGRKKKKKKRKKGSIGKPFTSTRAGGASSPPISGK